MKKINTPEGPMLPFGPFQSFLAIFYDMFLSASVLFLILGLLYPDGLQIFGWAGWIPGAFLIAYGILAYQHKVPSLGNWALAIRKYQRSQLEGHPGKGTVRVIEDLDISTRIIRHSTAIMLIGLLFSTAMFVVGAEGSSKPVSRVTEEGYVDGADGAELFYKVMGTGHDTLVVLHGGPGAGMHTVIPMMEPLTEEFTLIFYDQRGGGRSTLPKDTTQLQPHHFVEGLESVRNHFGLDQMNVVTHSFGAILVAEYAKKYPDRLRRMVFHGATGPSRAEAGKYYRAQAAASTESPDTALTNRASKLFQSLLNGTASDPVKTCREYEEISRQILIARGDSTNYEGTICNAPPEAIRYYYRYTAQLAPRYFGAWDYLEDLDEVTAPLLVVWGERDSLGIPMQRQWTEAVPNSRLLLVPDAGKGAFSDNPDTAFPEVIAFFQGAKLSDKH